MTDEEWQRHHDIQHEALDAKLDAILEYVRDVPAITERLGRIENDVAALKSDMAVVKDIVQTHAKDIDALRSASHTH